MNRVEEECQIGAEIERERVENREEKARERADDR